MSTTSLEVQTPLPGMTQYEKPSLITVGALAKKMVAAVADIDAVTKSGTNEKQGYKYVRATDVANEVRKVLVKHGIAFDYDVLSTERWDKPTNSGGMLFFAQLEIAVTFTDQDSGEARTVKSVGWGMDSGDKAPYKAMTGALKYALRMNFLIPDESDPENDSDEKPQKQVQATNAHPPTSSYTDEEFDQRFPVEPKKSAPKQAEQKQAPGPKDVLGKDAISEGKAKRFWAISLGKGKSKDDMAEALAAVGLSDIKFCPWKGDTYDNLIKWAEQ